VRRALRAALWAAPFLAAFLLIRAIGHGEAERWRKRVDPWCKGALVGVDEKDLIVIAADRDEAQAAAAEVRDFRRVLAARYGDLLGVPPFERMVVVVFPDVASVQAYAGETMRADHGATGNLHGYTDPLRGAIFVPRGALGTLRHEAVHWVMETARSRLDAPYSPWLSEGLAQLFETLDPLADPPQPPRLPSPLGPGDVDVDRLIRIEEYARFVGDDGLRNYRDALLLCAFLFETRPDALRRYVGQERKSATGRALIFRGIFEDDQDPFRAELRAFVARLAR
jgi:hypothetical protein